ncbi:MAG: class I SAM-dependent methyltransferase, partial [Elusimicrobia bacterium]|nr:class I SAM-dependent methyltransferase [Elusimicrobiota bacterium]
MSEDLDEAARRVGDGYRQALLRTGFYTSRAHSLLREDCVLHMYEIMDAARRIFVRLGWDAARIERASVLEVGCAWGLRLNQMPGFGLRPENMHGIDLLEEYIAEARKSNPGISYEVMSGTDLKFGDGAFDFSMAVMSLSAMIDGRLIDQVLAEMCRVSREFVLVCDNFDPNYRNLRNGKTVLKGVSTRHVEKLRSRDDVE